MKIAVFLLVLLFSILGTSQTKYPKDAILGKWQTYDEKTNEPNGIIQFLYIKGKLVGKVIDGPGVYNTDGSLKKDSKNSDHAKRNRLIKGMVFIYGLTWLPEEHKYNKGRIYDSRSGNTFSANMEMVSINKLKVIGYFGITLFGKTVYWTRVK